MPNTLHRLLQLNKRTSSSREARSQECQTNPAAESDGEVSRRNVLAGCSVCLILIKLSDPSLHSVSLCRSGYQSKMLRLRLT